MSIVGESGKKAEQLVADFLRRKGYIIAKMNYHSRFGEIDIIAENRQSVCFVEVKMRSENAIYTPAEAVDARKQQKIILTAKNFLSKSNIPELQPRFDVAEVYRYTDASGVKKLKIHYIKNAFNGI